MIPTALALGLVVGLTVRTWWSIPVLAALWAAWVAVETGDRSLGTLGLALLLGAVNAGVGVALGRGIRHLVSAGKDRRSGYQGTAH